MDSLPNTFVILDIDVKEFLEVNKEKVAKITKIYALKVIQTPNGLEVIQKFNKNTQSSNFINVLEDFLIFCEEYKLLIYSYGNVYKTIKQNLHYYKNNKQKYHYWEDLFLDVCDVLNKYIDTNQYNSNTVYSSFPININKNNKSGAEAGALSIFVTLDYILHHNSSI